MRVKFYCPFRDPDERDVVVELTNVEFGVAEDSRHLPLESYGTERLNFVLSDANPEC